MGHALLVGLEKWKLFFGLHYSPGLYAKVLLGLIPFIVFGWLYMSKAYERHEANEHDKLMPYPSKMVEKAKEYVVKHDRRSKKNLFIEDVKSTFKLFGIGVLLYSLSALFLGVMMGIFPWFRALMTPFILVISIVPALAILPIIFITFGTDDAGKIAVIVIGNLFLMTRDISRQTSEIPKHNVIKALTLGANNWQIIRRVIIPQVLPRFIETVRIYLSPAWLFLIAAEYSSSVYGLACRILYQTRQSNMALIIPIVIFMTAVGLFLNVLCILANRGFFPWYKPVKA
jgi:NitT/TauT family transport system permease protein